MPSLGGIMVDDSGSFANSYATTVIDSGSGYAARSSTAPAGRVAYRGPTQPSDALAGDTWTPAVGTPRPVIIDTDWYTDCDDVVAMRLAAYYDKAGAIDVRACILDTSNTNGAPSLDAFWRAESRPVQIGQLSYVNSDLSGAGPFQSGLMSSFKHYGLAASDFPDSTTVYRTVLAQAADGSVDIVSIGYLNALSNLLQSPGDGIDARTGSALVAAKVRRLYVMGGAYPSGTENNFSRTTKVIAAAAYVVGNWPTAIPVYFSGYEVGVGITTGDNLALLAPQTDQLYAAMIAHGSAAGRKSWDPMTVMVACLGGPTQAGYTTVRGTNAVDAGTGANTFTTGAGGPHYYLVKAQSNNYYKNQINNLLVPGRQTPPIVTGTQVLGADGVWRGLSPNNLALGATGPIVSGSVSISDPTVLSASMKASDAGVSNGASVATLSTTTAGVTTAWTTQSGNQPTYAAAKSGTDPATSGTVSKAALQFSGTQWLEASVSTSPLATLTVYARVLFDTLPTTNQTAVSQDTGSGTGRNFAVKAINGGIAQAAAFNSSTGYSDNAPGSLVAGTWHTLTIRKDATGVECLLDGVGDVALSQALSASTSSPLHIGVSKLSGSAGSYTANEGLIGYVAEVRMYNAKHTNAEVATYMAQLA